MDKVGVFIPARYCSTRLPGKPLVMLAGKSMIQRVYERAKLAKTASRVIVATDDERIVKAVEGFSGEARMTRADHRTGTERIAEVAAREEGEVFVNAQGDEPLLDPEAIDTAVTSLLEEPQASIGTVATPIKTPADIMDPNIVKVVTDFDGHAIYFSVAAARRTGTHRATRAAPLDGNRLEDSCGGSGARRRQRGRARRRRAGGKTPPKMKPPAGHSTRAIPDKRMVSGHASHC